MNPSYLLLLLVFASGVLCCFDVPLGDSTVSECFVIDGVLKCDYVTTSKFIYPVKRGACSRLMFNGASFDGGFVVPAQQLTVITTFVDVFIVQELTDVFDSWDSVADFTHDCTCPDAFNGRCQDVLGITPQCKSADQCQAWGIDCKSVHAFQCVDSSISGGCFANHAFWCGIVHSTLTERFYVGAFGSESLYAVIDVVITDGVQNYSSGEITFALNGFNTWQIKAGNFQVMMNFEEFNIPSTGLSGQGVFVQRYRPDVSPYVVSGVDTRSTVAPVTTPFWYRCVHDTTTCSYDTASYQQSFQIVPQGKCTDNQPGVSLTAITSSDVLQSTNRITNRVNPIYNFRNSSTEQSGKVIFGLNDLLSLNVQIINTAKSTTSVISEAHATAKLAGSASTCGDGEVRFWISGTNSGQSGLASLLIVDNNHTLNAGSVLLTTGPFNVSGLLFTYEPYAIQACVVTDVVSCVMFQPTCQTPNIPTNPEPADNGSPFHNASGSYVWWIWLLIVIAIIVGIFCCACCGFLIFIALVRR